MRPKALLRLPSRAFTLVEVVCALLIVLILGLGAVGSIIYTRQSLELDKQRLAALNLCRQAMEAAHTNAGINTVSVRPLVLFSTPDVEIPATIRVLFHPLSADGAVDWGTILPAPPGDQPVYCRVRVEWLPSGRWARRQAVVMDSLIRAGVK